MHPNLIQAYRQAPWRVQLQMIGLFSLALVMAGLIAGIYLNVTARAATTGREIQDFQEEILMLQRTNADLETQLALLTSTSTMESRARELGFQIVNPAEVIYVTVPGYAGRQEAVLAPPPGPVVSGVPELPPEFTQTLVEWLVEAALLQTEDFQPPGWLPEFSFSQNSEAGQGGAP